MYQLYQDKKQILCCIDQSTLQAQIVVTPFRLVQQMQEAVQYDIVEQREQLIECDGSVQCLFQPDMYEQKFIGVTKQHDVAMFSKLDK